MHDRRSGKQVNHLSVNFSVLTILDDSADCFDSFHPVVWGNFRGSVFSGSFCRLHPRARNHLNIFPRVLFLYLVHLLVRVFVFVIRAGLRRFLGRSSPRPVVVVHFDYQILATFFLGFYDDPLGLRLERGERKELALGYHSHFLVSQEPGADQPIVSSFRHLRDIPIDHREFANFERHKRILLAYLADLRKII